MEQTTALPQEPAPLSELDMSMDLVPEAPTWTPKGLPTQSTPKLCCPVPLSLTDIDELKVPEAPSWTPKVFGTNASDALTHGVVPQLRADFDQRQGHVAPWATGLSTTTGIAQHSETWFRV